MSILTKALVTAAFLALVVSLIALLPSVNDYPLPSSITNGMVVILGYYFAWSSVFTFLNTLFFFFTLTLFIEIYIWIAHVIMWIIGIVARFVG